MPVKGKEEHDREMALKAAATIPADLSEFDLPERMDESGQVGFAKGITAIRDGEFYLAHDLWEDVWHGYRPSDRLFLQGLIHIAVGSYHVQCQNARGSHSQLGKAITKMRPFGPRHWGIDVNRILTRVEALQQTSVAGPDIQNFLSAVQKGL